MAETADSYASMSLAVRNYGWTVKQIRLQAMCVSLDLAEERRRSYIASPKHYAFWDAVCHYIFHLKGTT